MITLTSLVSASSLYNSSAVSGRIASNSTATSSGSSLSSALESSRVQLSALGRVRSNTAQVENAAEDLRDSRKLASVDGLTKAVQGFATAVNNQVAAVAQAGNPRATRIDVTLPTGSTAGVGNVSTTNAGATAATRQSLQQIGVTVANDGRVSVDTQRLQSAFASDPQQVRQTLGQVANSVVRQSENQLAANSAFSRAETQASGRSEALQQAQDLSQTRLTEARRLVQQQDALATRTELAAQQAFSFSGATAYLRIFSS